MENSKSKYYNQNRFEYLVSLLEFHDKNLNDLESRLFLYRMLLYIIFSAIGILLIFDYEVITKYLSNDEKKEEIVILIAVVFLIVPIISRSIKLTQEFNKERDYFLRIYKIVFEIQGNSLGKFEPLMQKLYEVRLKRIKVPREISSPLITMKNK